MLELWINDQIRVLFYIYVILQKYCEKKMILLFMFDNVINISKILGKNINKGTYVFVVQLILIQFSLLQMQNFYNVTIAFGDKTGSSRSILLQQSKAKIEIKLKKKGQMVKPVIQTRKPPQIQLDQFTNILKNKRNKSTIASLLQVQDGVNQKVQENCERVLRGIKDDEEAIQFFRSNQHIDDFIKKTGTNEEVAEKYMKKHKSSDQAAQVYKHHQTKIEQFMKDYGCDRQNAINFLQNNNYQLPDY